MIALSCDHCGDDAITSESHEFSDGQGDRCESCGFPGTVSVDDADPEEVSAYWRISDDVEARCQRGQVCEECR